MTPRNRTWWLSGLVAGVTVALSLVLVVHAALVTDKLTTLIPLSFLVVGVIVSTRQPGNVEGWLLELVALAWAVILLLPFTGAWVIPVGLMGTHLLLRFPDGRLPSSRWRPVSWLATAVIVTLPVIVTTASKTLEGTSSGPNPYYVAWTEPFATLIVLLPVTMLLSATSLVLRYRRAADVQRHQIRWLTFAGSIVVGGYLLTITVSFTLTAGGSSWFGTETPLWLQGMQLVALASFVLIPAAFAVAILRYHLYDIDRVISRTTSYVIVTGLLLATYALIVTTATGLLPNSSTLAVAVATLAAAALARPLLHRVQAVVDRRFNRARYDAQRTVEDFSQRLRHEVDTDAVTDDLLLAVRRTMEPVNVQVWRP